MFIGCFGVGVVVVKIDYVVLIFAVVHIGGFMVNKSSIGSCCFCCSYGCCCSCCVKLWPIKVFI